MSILNDQYTAVYFLLKGSIEYWFYTYTLPSKSLVYYSILFTEKGQLSNCSFALSSFLLQDTCNLLYAYTEQFVACTTECVLITVQNSVTCCLERLNLVVSGSGEWWEVNRVRSGLTRELDHSRNRNHECREVASLTLAIAITNIMTGLHS